LLTIRRHRKEALIALSRYLEQQALEAKDHPMVLTALQRSEFFVGETRARHQQLAVHSPLVAVFGHDLADDLGGGVRGVRFERDDLLHSQWIQLALGANISTALVCREVADHRDATGGRDRIFDAISTNDRGLVTGVARQLLSRMLTPLTPSVH
jgi:DICT domain-containing protein